MDLFDHQRELLIDAEAPLAARMRPRTLDEFAGQSAIVGEGRVLRCANSTIICDSSVETNYDI